MGLDCGHPPELKLKFTHTTKRGFLLNFYFLIFIEFLMNQFLNFLRRIKKHRSVQWFLRFLQFWSLNPKYVFDSFRFFCQDFAVFIFAAVGVGAAVRRLFLVQMKIND